MMESTHQRPLAAGEMVDVFRIEGVLGAGGFGITYLATDTTLNVAVAIKEYFPRTAWRDQSARTVCCYAGEAEQSYQFGLERFYKEGQILSQFNHPNIVRVRRLLSANATAYLVMDYEKGETLDVYLKRLGRPLSYEESEAIFNPVLDGLRAIHDRNLLHLDIKPANIFLRSDSTPILIDFGGARHQAGQISKLVSFLVASDGYAPNEQYTGSQLQASTDIYAIAAAIYYSITLRVPTDSPVRATALIDNQHDPLIPVSQLVGNKFPALFIETLDSALSVRIANRPQSVREFQQRLFAPVSQPRPPINIPPTSSPTGNSQQQPILGTNPSDSKPRVNWLPVVAGVGGLIAVLLLVVLLKLHSQDVIKETQRQADEIKSNAESSAQKTLEQAQQALKEAKDAAAKAAEPGMGTAVQTTRQPAPETVGKSDSETSRPSDTETRKKKERDNLVETITDYYVAIAKGDADTVQRLWKDPTSAKALKAYRNVKKGGGGLCELKNESTNSYGFDSAFMQANLHITMRCDERRQNRGYQEYTVAIDFEKNSSDSWRITDWRGIK